ncbi:MAG: CtsR family transcriptional regulator [Clostridia bacterium]|nr:CtsR family transcriptional regulator [Clostridia bacterium]
MGLSDKIEQFIIELLKNEDDWLEIKRNELASVFNCVPSQINYVMNTRFNEKRGYMVESRRGGGGYIRIKKLNIGENSVVSEVISQIGDMIDFSSAKMLIEYMFSRDKLTKKEANMILSGISDRSLCISQPDRDYVRAEIFKNMLIAILQE